MRRVISAKPMPTSAGSAAPLGTTNRTLRSRRRSVTDTGRWARESGCRLQKNVSETGRAVELSDQRLSGSPNSVCRWMHRPTRNRYRRSNHACGAANAATLAPARDRTGGGCAVCPVSPADRTNADMPACRGRCSPLSEPARGRAPTVMQAQMSGGSRKSV
jgi:hypothetical protein